MQRGIGIMLEAKVPDTTDTNLDFRRMCDAALDVKATDELIMNNYRYADLLARSALQAAGYRQHNRGGWRKKRG